MTTYTVTLSPAEDRALSVVALSQNEWIQNAVHERCNVAMEDIVQQEVRRLLAAGLPIPSTRDEIVLSAQVETAAELNARLLEEMNQE